MSANYANEITNFNVKGQEAMAKAEAKENNKYLIENYGIEKSKKNKKRIHYKRNNFNDICYRSLRYMFLLFQFARYILQLYYKAHL